MKTGSFSIVIGSTLLLASSAVAQQDILTFTPPPALSAFPGGGDYVEGFAFSVTSPITVTGLSVFTGNYTGVLGTGLANDTPVGLWDSSQNLLASVTVLAGTANPLTSDGMFRYANLTTPLVLADGTYYVAAAELAGGDSTAFDVSGQSTIPGVTYLSPQVELGSSLVFPDISEVNPTGIYGGNVVVAAATPDASSSLLLLSGACLVMGALRRKLS